MFYCFTHIINDLKALGKTYPTKEMVKKMLNSLLTSWEPKVTKIEESEDFNSLSLDEFIGSLLTYEMKINYNAKEIKEIPKKVGVGFKSKTSEKDENSSNNDDDEEMTMFAKRFMSKQKLKAHVATWSDEDSSDNENQEVANLYLMTIDDIKEKEHCFEMGYSKKNLWYLDSGCSRHITDDKIHFIDLKPKSGRELTFGDNSTKQIKGIGSIGKTSSIIIENVLYVSGFKHNLLSISQLCDKGFNVIFESKGCTVIDIASNKIMLVKHMIEYIYMEHLDDMHNSSLCLIAKNKNSYLLWHRKLDMLA
ncbi:Retrovirus-related Pol polyprotein from transposon TNT 1-94 [Gossypium australe]|uniref:Retrovirus-related Pol polyprotein from transposon TNT 1-94 n=1 Tax=Gossypium australe TaxID=47621 RepID=A0A5B6W7R5_9ROSI|nr:Retrovirus-related Pol polyprotein from transposon TNT 1-94 [Gossypium australe]